MTREEFIVNVAQLLAGLQAPVSMGLPLGVATPAWTTLHTGLVRFGWYEAEDYEAAIRELLDGRSAVNPGSR